jgi:hypothetical protein
VVHGWDLSHLIEERVISDASSIGPDEEEVPLAIDVVGRFAALFWFSVDEVGAWSEDCAVALKTGDSWWPCTEGGGHGNGWETPWRPPAEGWKGQPIAIFGSVWMDLPDEADEMVEVRGLYGFATPQVASIRVNQGSDSRQIGIASPAGAFVVVVTGAEAVELQCLDDHGQLVGRLSVHP